VAQDHRPRPTDERPDARDDGPAAKAPPRERARDKRTGRDAAAERIRNQTQWVDLQVQKAMERGEFDDLPGAGKPLRLPDKYDPDWWIKRLIEREQITGVAPVAILLRKEDAELEDQLDDQFAERDVRRILEDFNRRVVEARRQLTGGPPVVTPTRDIDAEVEAWRERRAARRAEHQRELQEQRREAAEARTRTRRRWWWRPTG
jgi:Domain of unknown function (DUF1992)